MKGKLQRQQIQTIADHWQKSLNEQDFRDLAHALGAATLKHARECSPHWLDLNALSIELNIRFLESLSRTI